MRSPELRPLGHMSVAMFGVGCLGSTSAMALARAGVGELRLLDHDYVDPSTVGRWEVGVSAAGRAKVRVIRDLIERDYPFTKVAVAHEWKLGAVRNADAPPEAEQEILRSMTSEVSAIYDASAEVGVNRFLADYSRSLGIPYVCVAGTPGGWGGEVLRIAPATTEGCWYCHQHWWAEHKYGTLVGRPGDEVQTPGCGDPTYTGAGFDLAQIANTGVRMLVSTLCAGHDAAYPNAPFDVLLASFRTAEGAMIVPEFRGYRLERHPACRRCGKPE